MKRRLRFAFAIAIGATLAAGCSLVVSYDGYGDGVRAGDDGGGTDGTAATDGDPSGDGSMDGPQLDASEGGLDAGDGGDASKRHALVVLGGNVYDGGSNSTASVEYARINDDGTLGPFQLGPPMPYAEARIACAAWGSTIFVSEEDGAAAAVMLPDGGMSAWVSLPAIPREQARMVAFDGQLYIASGRNLSGTEVPEVFRATITGPQSIGAWTATTPLPLDGGPRHESTLMVDPVTRTLYLLGGDLQDVDMGSVLSTKIDGTGALGAWTENTPLAVVGDKVRAVSTGRHITLLGGSYDVGSDRIIHVAPILDGGTLGAWGSGGQHPTRDDPGWASHRDFAYLIGGEIGTSEDTPTVIVAQINPVTGLPGSWTTTSATIVPRHSMSAVVVELP